MLLNAPNWLSRNTQAPGVVSASFRGVNAVPTANFKLPS